MPAGIYGKQILTSLGPWDRVRSRVAAAANLRAALTLVECGEAPLGLVYASDALISGKVKVVGEFPDKSHPAIVCPVALVTPRLPGATWISWVPAKPRRCFGNSVKIRRSDCLCKPFIERD